MKEEIKNINTYGRYSGLFVFVTVLFVTAIITANIIAVKLFQLPQITLPWVKDLSLILPAGILIFPLSYIIGDVLTEVYGFRAARKVIWLAFFCNAVAVLFIWLGGILPPAGAWDHQESYKVILGYAPRLLIGSFAGYLVGELCNSFVLSRVKILTKGRWLWMRTIGSTILGQGLDSVLFITIAFSGVLPGGVLIELMLTQWVVKVLYETAVTPATYVVVGYLKKKEQLDTVDHDVKLSPLSLLK